MELIYLKKNMLSCIPLTALYMIQHIDDEKLYNYFMDLEYYFMSTGDCDNCHKDNITVIMYNNGKSYDDLCDNCYLTKQYLS